MPRLVDDALAEAAIALMVPHVRTHPAPDDLKRALEQLVRLEQARRGVADPLTGALPVLALLQGDRLKREFDLSVHAHTGWPVGAIIVDVKGLIRINAERGMRAADEVLVSAASALGRAVQGAALLRVHGDCLAALFLPSTGLDLEEAHLERVSVALGEVSQLLARAEAPVGFTVSALRLRIFDPSHWQVLGPLLVAEIERAHVMARRGLASGIQERELRLDGRVPAAATPRG
jgi:GGDEF domain-containing protein